jgi:hypothetical protein
MADTTKDEKKGVPIWDVLLGKENLTADLNVEVTFEKKSSIFFLMALMFVLMIVVGFWGVIRSATGNRGGAAAG